MADTPETHEENPHYAALNGARRAVMDELVTKIQEFQNTYDSEIVAALGGGVFYLGGILLRQQAMLLLLEQRVEELESLIR